jgi:hypothetical protein
VTAIGYYPTADNLKTVGLPLPRLVTFNDAVPTSSFLMFPDLWLRAERLGAMMLPAPTGALAFNWHESLNQP